METDLADALQAKEEETKQQAVELAKLQAQLEKAKAQLARIELPLAGLNGHFFVLNGTARL